MTCTRLLITGALSLSLAACFSLPPGPPGPQGATGNTGATDAQLVFVANEVTLSGVYRVTVSNAGAWIFGSVTGNINGGFDGAF